MKLNEIIDRVDNTHNNKITKMILLFLCAFIATSVVMSIIFSYLPLVNYKGLDVPIFIASLYMAHYIAIRYFYRKNGRVTNKYEYKRYLWLSFTTLYVFEMLASILYLTSVTYDHSLLTIMMFVLPLFAIFHFFMNFVVIKAIIKSFAKNYTMSAKNT